MIDGGTDTLESIGMRGLKEMVGCGIACMPVTLDQ